MDGTTIKPGDLKGAAWLIFMLNEVTVSSWTDA